MQRFPSLHDRNFGVGEHGKAKIRLNKLPLSELGTLGCTRTGIQNLLSVNCYKNESYSSNLNCTGAYSHYTIIKYNDESGRMNTVNGTVQVYVSNAMVLDQCMRQSSKPKSENTGENVDLRTRSLSSYASYDNFSDNLLVICCREVFLAVVVDVSFRKPTKNALQHISRARTCRLRDSL